MRYTPVTKGGNVYNPMPKGFAADRPNDCLSARAARLAPSNPFQTIAYLRAEDLLGAESWVFTVAPAAEPERMCFGYIKAGWLNRILRIPSVPVLAADSPFWAGLDAFCQSHYVTQLDVATMGREGAAIPPWHGETERIARTEFVFDLRPDDLLAGMSKGHRERIKKGRKHGLTIRRGHADALIDAHVNLHLNSMDRRRDRGESVPEEFQRDIPAALLQTGAGELYQAMMGETVVSSLLVISSATGAYSESSGNSPEGMTIGASHFLRYETALALKDKGVELFYLGGAREHEVGLRTYKEGFGTIPLPMESMTAYVGKAWRRQLAAAAEMVRS
jgi:hypothetical protein